MAKRRTAKDAKEPEALPAEPVKVLEGANVPVIRRANTNRKVETVENFASIYANDIQLQTTPWDVRIIFGRIVELGTSDDPSATIHRLAEVHMSPQLAKKLTLLLINQLQHYERQMGDIPQPKD